MRNASQMVLITKEHLFPMKTLADIKCSDSSYLYSLAKLTGSPVVDARIGFTREWGETLVTVYSLILEDGRTLGLQGEHDIVYTYDDVVPQEQLDLFYEEENAEV